MLAAIHADQADTAKRLVYADVLSARNDPRGEFISLQCQRADGATPSARERELLKNYGRTWLGPLEAAIKKQGLVYRRGFIAEARETAQLKTEFTHPIWNTLEALEIDSWGPSATLLLESHTFPVLQRLYTRCEVAAALTRPMPSIRVLGLLWPTVDELKETLEGKVFPNLEVLELPAIIPNLDDALGRRRLKVVRANSLSEHITALRGRVDAVEIITRSALGPDKAKKVQRFVGPKLAPLPDLAPPRFGAVDS